MNITSHYGKTVVKQTKTRDVHYIHKAPIQPNANEFHKTNLTTGKTAIAETTARRCAQQQCMLKQYNLTCTAVNCTIIRNVHPA